MNVQQQINKKVDIPFKLHEVKASFVNDFNLRYKKVRKKGLQTNSSRCLVLRQQYAYVMLDLLQKGKRVINVDETWI